MGKLWSLGMSAACAALVVAPTAHADRTEPPPIYGYYDAFVDFAKQTFNGVPTPMKPITFPVEFTTFCDVNGCVPHWDNTDDLSRNPTAPAAFEYRWNNGRWETSGEYPYLCDRDDPGTAVPSTRSDFLIPRPDGSFFGERTLVVDGAGCPGEGPGTHWLPISLTPIDPPPE
jgi:hypothetical protein